MSEWLTPQVIQGGVVSVMAVFCWRLVWALITQAKQNAELWQAAAQADRQRADEAVRQVGEVLSALRAVETLIRTNHHARDTL